MGYDKLVDSSHLDASLATIADAIRTKGGTSASLAFPDGFVSAVEAIPTGGAETSWLAFFTGDLSLSSDQIVYSGPSVSGKSLNGQKNVKTISFPYVKTLRDGNSYYRFANMTNLEKFEAPLAEYVDDYMLYNCVNLRIVNFQSLLDSANGLLEKTNVEVVVLPSIKTVYARAFRDVTSLRVFDGLILTGFTNQNNFNGCANFDTLIIRKSDGVASLANINNFTGTPFASGGSGGTLYVPSALIASYQSATNWSTILGYANNQILSIEGSIYETQYADGTPIT